LKKKFELTATNKEPQRVLEAIKNDIRKYIKREKRKPLPEGCNVWNIECKFGQNEDQPQTIEFQDIIKSIDEASQNEAKSIYIELISNAIAREKKVIENENIEQDSE